MDRGGFTSGPDLKIHATPTHAGERLSSSSYHRPAHAAPTMKLAVWPLQLQSQCAGGCLLVHHRIMIYMIM